MIFYYLVCVCFIFKNFFTFFSIFFHFLIFLFFMIFYYLFCVCFIFKNIFTLSHVPEHGQVLDQGGVVHGVLLTTGEALAIKPKSPLAHFLTMSSLLWAHNYEHILSYAMLSISSANIGVTQTFNQHLYLKPNKVCLETYHHTNFQKNWWSETKVLLHTRPHFWLFDLGFWLSSANIGWPRLSIKIFAKDPK